MTPGSATRSLHARRDRRATRRTHRIRRPRRRRPREDLACLAHRAHDFGGQTSATRRQLARQRHRRDQLERVTARGHQSRLEATRRTQGRDRDRRIDLAQCIRHRQRRFDVSGRAAAGHHDRHGRKNLSPVVSPFRGTGCGEGLLGGLAPPIGPDVVRCAAAAGGAVRPESAVALRDARPAGESLSATRRRGSTRAAREPATTGPANTPPGTGSLSIRPNLPSRPEASAATASGSCRAAFASSPNMSSVIAVDVPPADTRGNWRPVTGSSPTT